MKANYMVSLIYRFDFFFAALGNLLYITVIYFLWKSIYKSSSTMTINGLTFEQVFIYLTLASSLFVMFNTFTEWNLSRKVISGTIINDLTEPLDFQFRVFFLTLGVVISNLVIIVIPSVFIVFCTVGAKINFGINIQFYFASLILSFLITFLIDFITGLTSFYTESIWGITTAKEITVLLLSGGIIPLDFFPLTLRKVIDIFPFHAIYNTPITMLTSKNLTIWNYLHLLMIQAFWVIILFILSRLLYSKAIKVVTVNGG